jgi:hypothetical protein
MLIQPIKRRQNQCRQFIHPCDKIPYHNKTPCFSGETTMNDKSPKEISRRDAIKILAAVAGATALVNLPDKWTKPGMEVGVLPAHAQTSLGLHTLAAGPDDPDANFCLPLVSTATITPPTFGIPMHYVITPSLVTITSPALVGTVSTDAFGVASLSIDASGGPFPILAGAFVRVTWSFENASDGIGNGTQVFTNLADIGGC